MAAINGEEQERMDLFLLCEWVGGWVGGKLLKIEKLGFVCWFWKRKVELWWWGQWNQVITHSKTL